MKAFLAFLLLAIQQCRKNVQVRCTVFYLLLPQAATTEHCYLLSFYLVSSPGHHYTWKLLPLPNLACFLLQSIRR